MVRGPIKKEHGVRKKFNDFLDYVFEKAKEVYETGKQSRLNLSEFERMAIEKKVQEQKGEERITITKNVDQMRKWITDMLNTLKKDFAPQENAINEGMALYNIFENAKTPEKLGEGLKKWAAG